jgi:PAS domain S-box-containing protein
MIQATSIYPASMSFTQNTLRSFVNSDGKLVLCNEPFFAHFGCCTEHLIGKSLSDVFASDSPEIVQAVHWCKTHPGESCTVDMEKQCKEGCTSFRWVIYAEQQQGRVTGIHIIGNFIRPEKAA